MPRKSLPHQARRTRPLLPKEHAGPGRGHKGPGRKHQGGNSRAYLLARLARDRPDLLEQLKRGELRSVRQAAQLAGWVRLPGPRLRQTGEREWTIEMNKRTAGFIRQNKDDRWTVWGRNDTGEGFSPVFHCQRFEEATAWWQQ